MGVQNEINMSRKKKIIHSFVKLAQKKYLEVKADNANFIHELNLFKTGLCHHPDYQNHMYPRNFNIGGSGLGACTIEGG